MDESTVADVARGRVWTGAQASEIGLVDELGDFRTALELAKELAGIASEVEVPVVGLYARRLEQPPLPYPGEQVHWQRVLGSLSALAREGVWTLSPWTLRIEG
jgi:ClpP class serine protease